MCRGLVPLYMTSCSAAVVVGADKQKVVSLPSSSSLPLWNVLVCVCGFYVCPRDDDV